MKKTRKVILALGAVLILLPILMTSIWGDLFIWQMDRLRGWEVRLQTEVPPYSVELVHEPGFDFYYSYFLIKKTNGETAVVLIDGDDSKWRNPQIIRQNGKTYFVRGSGEITDRTPFIDPENNSLFSGHYQTTYNLSELEFRNEQDLAIFVKPLVD